MRELRPKTLVILLPRDFQGVYFLLLTFGFSPQSLLLLQFHRFAKGGFNFCIDLLDINHKLEAT